MTTETRVFIELSDIVGIEFECPKCATKILYSLSKSYDRLAEKCPNCFEPWFEEPNRRISDPTTSELIRRTVESLRNISSTTQVKAHVRAQISRE
jgi:hypothetical protein